MCLLLRGQDFLLLFVMLAGKLNILQKKKTHKRHLKMYRGAIRVTKGCFDYFLTSYNQSWKLDAAQILTLWKWDKDTFRWDEASFWLTQICLKYKRVKLGVGCCMMGYFGVWKVLALFDELQEVAACVCLQLRRGDSLQDEGWNKTRHLLWSKAAGRPAPPRLSL